MDIFDLIGPVMVGPSSSHTAGAAKIGMTARQLLGESPVEAEIMLVGSFAATGIGHGTDRALVAGLLGMRPEDERIPDSFRYAREQGLTVRFTDGELPGAHPNTACLHLTGKSGRTMDVEAASVGGGRIEVRRIGDMHLRFGASQPTLIVRNEDQPGSVADVSRVLAGHGINIATFQLNRTSRGEEAMMVIECDAPLRETLAAEVRALPGILGVVCLNPEQEV
mgnify:CR=1 FL=1